jgi:hypothetical protein
MTESRLVYDYVKLNAKRLPEYWKDKGTHVCIDGVCCMIARGRYTFAEIAELYECPVALIMQINETYEKTVAKYKAMDEEMKNMYGELYTNHNVSDNNAGYLELACLILERCKHED